MNIPGLRSPYVKTGGIYYFARMIDKARLHAEGKLPADYTPNLGTAFDGRCLSFLGIEYPAFVARVKQGGVDPEILDWAMDVGNCKASDEQIEIWNEYMRKRGLNDSGTERLAQRKAESGLQNRDDIKTFFDYIDADEGRPLTTEY